MAFYIMFTYPQLLISYVYTETLYHLLHVAYGHTAIAHPYMYMYIFLLIPLHLCVYKVVVVKLLDYLLDITARSRQEAETIRYSRINIC
jgi:hypothetical protein